MKQKRYNILFKWTGEEKTNLSVLKIFRICKAENEYLETVDGKNVSRSIIKADIKNLRRGFYYVKDSSGIVDCAEITEKKERQ